MADGPTICDLWKIAKISDQEIDAAIDAYLADKKLELFRFACGYELNVAAAIRAYQPAKTAFDNPVQTQMFRRLIARTAILLAHPVRK